MRPVFRKLHGSEPMAMTASLRARLQEIPGYGIIAVPTGIVTAELTRGPASFSTQACPDCGKQGPATDARFCKHCGAEL